MEFILPQDEDLLHYGKFFKFLSVDSAIKTLKSGKLRYSNPTIFNDPLDCSKFLFDFKISKEMLTAQPPTPYEKELVGKLINERYGQSLIDSVDWVYDLKKLKAGINDEMKISFLKRTQQEIFSKEEIEKYRIACFSKSYYSEKSFLMWSHYAESHKGICLEFDNRKESDLNKLKKFAPVNVQYQSMLPNIRTKVEFESNNWLWIKSNLFKYEGEVRIIRKMNKARSSSSFAFPKKYLTKIIFGVNTSVETIKKVKTILLDQYELDEIDYEKMDINKKNWRLAKNNYDIHKMVPYKI